MAQMPGSGHRLPLAKEGLPFLAAGVGLCLLCLWLGAWVFLGLFVVLTLFVAYFFRDPDRVTPVIEKAVVTPADGRILDVKHLPDKGNPLEQPAYKISIFMSIFNVHVNRIPLTGIIHALHYKPGKFVSANLDKASDQNESNRITLETFYGKRVVFIQIAGLIARRIVCWVREGDRVKVGDRFGLIRFGSRLDVFVPDDSRIVVKAGDKVHAGQTILGYLS